MASERPNSRFDRRQFARAASSGLALFAIPGWFAACARTKPVELAPSSLAARPKLVLHVSSDPFTRWKLGRAFGVFLMHATDEQLAPLATCELACARTDELSGLGLDLADVHALVLVPGAQPRVALSGAIPEPDPQRLPRTPEAEAANVERSDAWVAAQLARALGPGSEAHEHGARLELETRGPLPAGAMPSLARASDSPCLALYAASDPATREVWLALLAQSLRQRWNDVAPEGSSWANATGCGDDLERPLSVDNYGIDCGMGFVPTIGKRFLHLFSTEELAGG